MRRGWSFLSKKRRVSSTVTMVEILKSKHHFLDLVQVGFILTDVHSKILYANRYVEQLFGYAREEIEEQRIRVLFLEEDLTYLLPNIVYLTLYKSGFEGEVLLRQKDGKKIFIHLYTTSFTEAGEVYLTFSLQEIQRLKKLERERLEMEHWASLGKMVEEIAHQVRNPIVSIGGYTQRIQKLISPSQRSKSYLDRILKESKKLETIVQRVEEYVLIPRPFFEKERIEEVVETALRNFSREATEKGISFNLDTGTLGGDESLFIDRDLVIKALSHILENSIEATLHSPPERKQKTVKVALFGDEEDVGISISDNGEGIPKKNLPHIFEPFFSTRPGKVGLGLTLVKRVVEEHGGRIRMESRSKRGTTATLIFRKDRRRKIRKELISPNAKTFNGY